MQKTLYIDSIDNHSNEENCISIHPSHLNFLDAFDKSSFNKIIIKNSPSEFLNAKGLFYVNRCLKKGGICEIIVDQPFVVMQDTDAEEIEANCKLAGFEDINIESYSSNEIVNGVEKKIQTLKLSMEK
jgi:hypothetical protein